MPVKATAKTGELAGKGVYHTGKGAVDAGELAGKGVYYTGKGAYETGKFAGEAAYATAKLFIMSGLYRLRLPTAPWIQQPKFSMSRRRLLI